MHFGRAVGMLLALMGGTAQAYSDEEDEAPWVDRRMQPGEVDLRLQGETNFGFRYAEPGIAADLALALLEPGTLSLGLEVGVGLCSTASCGAAVAPSGGAQLVLPSVRLAYHWLLTRVREFQRVDGFVLLMGGPAVATSGGAVGFGGGFAAGGGVSYFVAEPVFLGLELRWRLLAGGYPGATAWNLSGIGLRLYVGVRL